MIQREVLLLLWPFRPFLAPFLASSRRINGRSVGRRFFRGSTRSLRRRWERRRRRRLDLRPRGPSNPSPWNYSNGLPLERARGSGPKKKKEKGSGLSEASVGLLFRAGFQEALHSITYRVCNGKTIYTTPLYLIMSDTFGVLVFS